MPSRQTFTKTSVWGVLAVFVAYSLPSVTAQQPPPSASPTLEVASVRRNTSGTFQQSINMQPGGTLVVNNFLVSQLVPIAFALQQPQVVGGPAWIREDRFDIIAKNAAGISNREVLRTLLRVVLTERFKLMTHTEKREQPVYALVPAKPDRRPGPKLLPVASGCGVQQSTTATAPTVPPRCDMRIPPGRIIAIGADMTMLASALGTRLGRVVIDRTGFTGWFDIDVQFEGDFGTPETSASLITALQEQLGLKVDPDRAPLDMLVIDSIQQPTKN